ncbi:MAG: hypothetical protein ACQEWV_20135 [Bacillota bacterium]
MIYSTKESAVSVFEELFTILINDGTVNSKMREAKLDARIVHKNPDFEVYFSPEKVLIDSDMKDAAISIRMSCDTAHSLWRGELLMPLALAMGKVRIKGSIPKVLEFVPLLEPAFNRYEEIYEKHRSLV